MAPLVESINTKQKYNPVTVFATVRRRIYEYDRTILGGGGRESTADYWSRKV